MPIKLLALDIDGVLTDGKKTLDLNGQVISKCFFDRDFAYIEKIRTTLGIKVFFISGDDRVNKKIALHRNIPFIHAINPEDKRDQLLILTKNEQIGLDETAAVGDSEADILMLKLAHFSFAPISAEQSIINIVSFVLPVRGGDGVIERIYPFLEKM